MYDICGTHTINSAHVYYIISKSRKRKRVNTLRVGKLGFAKGKPGCVGGVNRFAVGMRLRRKESKAGIGSGV